LTRQQLLNYQQITSIELTF